jgi:transposase
MDMRELKALEIAARSRVTFDGKAWVVPSQSGNGTYRVTIGNPSSCTCEDFALRQLPCKHVIAARLVRERDGEPKAPPIDTDTLPKKPTYKQNWPAYNLAQTTERHRLRRLLAELASGVPPLPRSRPSGRLPTPMADQIFSVVYKVYSTLSTRRFNCDLQDAHEAGYLSAPVHFNKVNTFLCEEYMTPILRGLVERSALPLRAVETDFAVDSTGFGTCKFVRWFDEKYGVHRTGHDWVKVHIATGVRTNVVTAVEIKGRDAHDCPVLPELVTTTAKNFKIGEVSGDKGYLSVENVETIAALGGVPFISPKTNTTGNAGGLFERMFHYYQYRREEFLKHYHKRSNVESTFSAVKRKFGDALRSRNPVAMVNEALAKFICHNLCCVILSQIELGVEAEFWTDEPQPADEPAIIPLRRNG